MSTWDDRFGALEVKLDRIGVIDMTSCDFETSSTLIFSLDGGEVWGECSPTDDDGYWMYVGKSE